MIPYGNNKFKDLRIFIAYSNVYFNDAIDKIKDGPTAECIIIQPHIKGNFFTSSKKALGIYKECFSTDGIPILITLDDRRKAGGQLFRYGGKLIDILDNNMESNKILINDNFDSGKWIYPINDKPDNFRNVLIIKTAIETFPDIPVTEARNVLHNYNSEVKAVSIAAPKLLDPKHISLLERLAKL